MSLRATLTPMPPLPVEEASQPVPLRPAVQRALLLLGLFQVIVGAALLMVPHRFEGGPFTGWLDRPIVFGGLAVVAGGILLWIRILPVRRSSVVAAGLALTALNFASAFAMNAEADAAHWLVFFGTAALASFALMILLAGRRENLPVIGLGRTFSLAALMAQVAALATGVLMLGYPDAYADDVFHALQPALNPIGGALWFLGGVLIVANFLDGKFGRRLQAVGNLLLAAVWIVVASLLGQEGSWFGVLTSATLALGALDQTPVRFSGRRWSSGALAMNSARRRVILTSATASLAIALGLTLALATYQEASIRDQLERQQRQTAASVASELGTFLRSQMGAVDLAMDFVGVQSLDPALARIPLGDVAWDYPAFSNCSVTDNAGFEVYRTDGRLTSNRATDPAIKRAMSGALGAYGPIRANPNTGQPGMTMATALFDNATGVQVGTVSCDLPLTAINEFVQGIAGSEDYDFIVVDRDGLLISHPDAIALAQRDTFAMTSAVGASLAGGSGTMVEATGGEEVMTGYATMAPPWSWGVLVETPESVAVADIQAAREQTLVLLGLATAVVVVLSFILAYVVLKPAADLVAPVTAVGEGRWDVELPAADDSELGSLIRAFGQMRQQIHDREAELVRRNEELSAARLKSQFLMTMTHELRSPMDGILGYGHLLLDGVDGDLTPEQAADVAQITASAELLMNLINNVLDFSLLESGEMHLTPAPTDIAPLVEGLRGQYALAAAQKGLDLAIDVQPGLPEAIVEAESLKKILANVVGNAIKFTEEGRITIAARATDSTVEIAVTDTGIGIPPEALDLIFEEFRQVDSSLNRRFGGAGLGLAIARRIAEMQGAQLGVVSQLGIGSTFTLTMPRAVVQPAAPATPVDRAAVSPLSDVGRRLARLRILQQQAPAPVAAAPTPPTPEEEPLAAGTRARDNGRY
jgi:signal transduction histidine kinase